MERTSKTSIRPWVFEKINSNFKKGNVANINIKNQNYFLEYMFSYPEYSLAVRQTNLKRLTRNFASKIADCQRKGSLWQPDAVSIVDAV
jgi:hypothetical protein